MRRLHRSEKRTAASVSRRRPARLAACAAGLTLALLGTPAAHAADPVLDPPVSAAWHLNEFSGGVSPEAHGIASLEAGQQFPGVSSISDGRFGNAIRYENPSNNPSEGMMVIPMPGAQAEPQRITVAAWVRATAPGILKAIVVKGASACNYSSWSLDTGMNGSLRFFTWDGAVAHVAPETASAAALWNGEWHMVAGTYDGAAVRLWIDGVQVGTGTPATGPIDYLATTPGASKWLTFAGYPLPFSCGNNTRWLGDLDEVRIYDRALNRVELERLAAAAPGPDAPPSLIPDPPVIVPTPTTPSFPVDPPPPADPGPSSGGAGGVDPAAVAAQVNGLAQTTTGGFDTIRADVSDPAARIYWDTNGDGKPNVVGLAGQDAISFRSGTAAAAVMATARNGAGTGAPKLLRIPGSSKPAPGQLAKALVTADKIAKQNPIALTGSSKDLTSIADAERKLRYICAGKNTVHANGLAITGCLLPVRAVEDIPESERGIMAPAIQALGLPQKRPPLDATNAAINRLDGFMSYGSVDVNGVTLNPGKDRGIVAFPQLNVLGSSSAAVELGNVKLAARERFLMDLRSAKGVIDLGSFGVDAASVRKALGGFPIVGDISVKLIPAKSSFELPTAEIIAKLKLPDFLSFGGAVKAEGFAKLRAEAGRGLILDTLEIGPIDVNIGAMKLTEFKITYTEASDTWRGQARACVAEKVCIKMLPEDGGGVTIVRGGLKEAGAVLDFPPPGLTLYPGVTLDSIGFKIATDPTKVVGSANVSLGKLYDIHGKALFTFPSERTPYTLTGADFDPKGGIPGGFFSQRFTRPTVILNANAGLKLPQPLGRVPFASGYLIYEFPDYVAFGGHMNQSFYGVFSASAFLNGEINFGTGAFNVMGGGEACIIGICRGATVIVSSRGAGACVKLGPLNIGGGVLYNPFSVKIWPLDGCKWSPFAVKNVRGARLARQGGPYEVSVRAGDRGKAIQLEGASEAPRVRVTAPGGASITTDAGSVEGPNLSYSADQKLRIMRDPDRKLTVVGLQDPVAGTYRIEPLPGTAPATRILEAEDQPDADIDVRVEGRGDVRVLRYDIRRRDQQLVTFVEVDGLTERVIGTARNGSGEIEFTPAPGGGVRKIEARVELDGLGAERQVVEQFRPPSAVLAKPQDLDLDRTKNGIELEWDRVAGARRYEVIVSASGLPTRTFSVTGTAIRVTLDASSSAEVAVRAVGGQRSSPATNTTAKRLTAPTNAVRALPKAPAFRAPK